MEVKPHKITAIKEFKPNELEMIVEFDQSEVRTVSVAELAKNRPLFRKLRDKKVFNGAIVTKEGDIAWDFDTRVSGPVLYHMGVPDRYNFFK